MCVHCSVNIIATCHPFPSRAGNSKASQELFLLRGIHPQHIIILEQKKASEVVHTWPLGDSTQHPRNCHPECPSTDSLQIQGSQCSFILHFWCRYEHGGYDVLHICCGCASFIHLYHTCARIHLLAFGEMFAVRSYIAFHSNLQHQTFVLDTFLQWQIYHSQFFACSSILPII